MLYNEIHQRHASPSDRTKPQNNLTLRCWVIRWQFLLLLFLFRESSLRRHKPGPGKAGRAGQGTRLRRALQLSPCPLLYLQSGQQCISTNLDRRNLQLLLPNGKPIKKQHCSEKKKKKKWTLFIFYLFIYIKTCYIFF